MASFQATENMNDQYPNSVNPECLPKEEIREYSSSEVAESEENNRNVGVDEYEDPVDLDSNMDDSCDFGDD